MTAMVNSILTGHWISTVPFGWLLILVFSLLGYLLLRISAKRHFFVCVFGISVGIVMLGLWSFIWMNVQIPWFFSLTGLWVTSIVIFIENTRLVQLHLLTAGEVKKDFSGVLTAVRDGLAPANGARFGRYHILELIGIGGMGEVYKATSYGAGGFSKDFALKRIIFRGERTSTALGNFEAEARLNSILTHANIAQVFEFFRMKDTILDGDGVHSRQNIGSNIGKTARPSAHSIVGLYHR